MLTPLPMQRVELSLLKDDAAAAALLLASRRCFNPEASEVTPQELPDVPGESYRQAHNAGQTHLEKILAHYQLAVPDSVGIPLRPVTLDQLTEVNTWLNEVWAQCSEQQERMRALREDYHHTVQLLKTLEQFTSLNIEFTQLQKQSRVMNVRTGVVSRANAQRFEEAIGLAGHVAIRFFTGLEQVHLIVAGPSGEADAVDRVFQSAGWRAMEIPPEFQGRPAEMRTRLTGKLTGLEEQQAHESAQRSATLGKNNLRQRLFDAAHTLIRAAPYAQLSGLMRGRGSLVTASGWVPNGEMPALQRMLEETLDARFVLHARNPRADERLLVPSLIRHHPWLRPFSDLVLQYGVPRYGEIDPTLLFAITFVLMFGMMFGDLGQGAIIAVGGMVMRQRGGPYSQYGALAIAAGISAACFGLLYGSVFGFEDVLPALWMPPLADPMRMLGLALGWGVVFILLATALTIRNRIVDGRIRLALLDSRGAAGLVLYLSMMLGAYGYASQGMPGLPALSMLLAAIAAMLAQSWQHSRGSPIPERALVSVMEVLEAVMAYVSNTLSFLRLAAFSLNHVALTIAVFTIGHMMRATGYWASVVLGNIFIIVLEGAIVAIQTLRLEYYEGFSRFFGGDGRPFQPLRLGRDEGLAIRT